MEPKIYTESNTALKTAKALAYIAAANLPALATIDWHEDQIENALKKEENESNAFNMPAVFFQFSETKVVPGANVQDASGELTLHLAQDKVGKDGRDGAETKAAFMLMLNYAELLVDILGEDQLPCSARLVLIGIERDHTNTPIMHEKITFKWSGKFRRNAVPPV